MSKVKIKQGIYFDYSFLIIYLGRSAKSDEYLFANGSVLSNRSFPIYNQHRL